LTAADEQWKQDQKGALVEDVKSGSWAELGALYVGDLIVEVDGQPVTNVDSLHAALDHATALKEPTVQDQGQTGHPHRVYRN